MVIQSATSSINAYAASSAQLNPAQQNQQTQGAQTTKPSQQSQPSQQTQQSQRAQQSQQARQSAETQPTPQQRVDNKEQAPRPVVNAQGQKTGTLINVIAG